ncbi:MAG: DNA gyrase inhibitor YacG [Planctomycetia bacterium]|nr:DNA gyrase inhibitor YacG [Planctomycetia bacterium]
MKCPICGKTVSQDSDAPLPFCCERCRMIDAKRWLNEEYSIETVDLDALEREIAGVDDGTTNDSQSQ